MFNWNCGCNPMLMIFAVISLLLVLGLSCLKFGSFSFQSDILADGAAEFFLNYAFFLNLGILLFSVIPMHYFWGEVKGLETDGLQIIHALKKGKV